MRENGAHTQNIYMYFLITRRLAVNIQGAGENVLLTECVIPYNRVG